MWFYLEMILWLAKSQSKYTVYFWGRDYILTPSFFSSSSSRVFEEKTEEDLGEKTQKETQKEIQQEIGKMEEETEQEIRKMEEETEQK